MATSFKSLALTNLRTHFAPWSSYRLALVLLIAAHPASADEEKDIPEIIGDRPDFTESAKAVPPLHAQGELGVEYSTIGSDGVLILPNLLMRIGAIEHLEIRFGAPSWVACFRHPGLDWGVSSVELGVKGAWDLGRKGAVGVLPYAALPVYGSRWRSTGLELGIKGLWSVDFNDLVSLGGNVGVVFEGVAPKEVDFEPVYLASLSLGLSPLDWFGIFVETYVLFNNDLTVIAVADGGFTFQVSKRVQLDIYAGAGLTPDARGFDVGSGVIFIL